MNSTILSFIYSLWCSFLGVLRESRLWLVLDKVHGFFRKGFADSTVVKAVKYEGKTKVRKTSLFYRLFNLPVFIISYFCKKLTPLVRYFVKKSIIASLSREYLQGFLALDVRFFGSMLVSMGGVSLVAKLIAGSFSGVSLITAVAGLIMLPFKLRLADYLDGSAVIRFVKHSFGFSDYSFKIYKKCSYTYISAVLIGALSGLLMIISNLAAVLPVGIFGILTVIAYPLCGVFYAVFIAPILPTMALVGMCVLTICSSLGGKAYRGDYNIKIGRVGTALIFFLVIMAVSVVFSFGKLGSIGVFGMYLIFISFYFTLINEVKSKETLSALIKIFVISGFTVAAYGVMQYLFGWTTKNAWIDTDMFEEATMRVYSTLANPNVLGEYLLLALPLSALCFAEFAKSKWEKLVYAVMFVTMLVCLVLTQSRGCWIGFFVSAFVFVTYYRSSLWKILPLFILILPFVLPQTVINRFLSVGNMSDSSTSYRVYIWLGTLDMLKNFWLSGIGPGEAAFRAVYPYYSYTGIVAPHSHNLYLQLIVESGVCSLIVFAAAVVMFLKNMINVQNRGRNHGIVAAAIMSGVLGFLVQSMFDYTFYNYRVMAIFFMILAFGQVLLKSAEKEEVPVEENN